MSKVLFGVVMSMVVGSGVVISGVLLHEGWQDRDRARTVFGAAFVMLFAALAVWLVML